MPLCHRRHWRRHCRYVILKDNCYKTCASFVTQECISTKSADVCVVNAIQNALASSQPSAISAGNEGGLSHSLKMFLVVGLPIIGSGEQKLGVVWMHLLGMYVLQLSSMRSVRNCSAQCSQLQLGGVFCCSAPACDRQQVRGLL